MVIRLKLLEDSESQMLWITTTDFTESDWPLRFLIRLRYTEYWSLEWFEQVGKYHLEIHTVSPEAAGAENCRLAAMSCDIPEDHEYSREMQCEILVGYGTSACLWQEAGNNKTKLLRQAKQELARMQMLFGFYMDRQMNALGATGWDFIRGDPTLRRRLVEDDTNPDLTKEDQLLGEIES